MDRLPWDGVLYWNFNEKRQRMGIIIKKISVVFWKMCSCDTEYRNNGEGKPGLNGETLCHGQMYGNVNILGWYLDTNLYQRCQVYGQKSP